MDLTNLTFDELLDAIRSDSGYQSAKARKIPVPTPAAPIAEEIKPEPITESGTVSEPISLQLVAEETTENVSEPIDISFADNKTEPISVDPEPTEQVRAESLPESSVTDNLTTSVTAEEEIPAWIPPSPTPFYEPVALAAEEEPEAFEEDDAVAFDPMQFSKKSVTADTVQESAKAVSAPKPIELVLPEEQEDEESIKIYTPPIPEPIDFYGFKIDTDIASLFPEVTDESGEPFVAEANEKTRVIEPVAQVAPEPSIDKTRVVTPAKNDQTKAVPFPPVFERPGIVTTSSAYDKTSDLNALPHILPADEFVASENKKFLRTGEIPKIDSQPKAPVVRHEEEEEQMVLPGFFEIEEVVRVSENEVEEELKRTRSRKVDSFKLEGADIEEPSMNPEVSQELTQGNNETKRRKFSRTKTRHRLNKQRVEYTKPSDAKDIHRFITRKNSIALMGAIVTAVCSFILFITTGIPFIAEKINSGSSDTPATHIISLVFLLISVGAALPACISGITCFFNGTGRPNSQTPVILAAAAALLHNIITLGANDADEVPVFSLAATFLLCCCSIGNILIYKRTKSNFSFLFRQGKEGMYSVRSIDNAIDANRVSQNVVMGDADIRYSGKLKFAARFMSYSLSSNSADDLSAKLVPILVGISALIGIIAGIITKSFAGGLGLFCGALCMGAPVCAVIASNLPLLIENKKLNNDGAMLSSYAAAFEYESTNAIALDASDLFPGESCNIHGMKTFNGVRVDDAVLTAASMLIAAGGPISSLFENVIMEHNELLLKVEDLKYEERLGLSGWIRERRIFVGNRKLLENHNIEIPMSVDESKYIRGDRQIIYLADAGKIAAFFVVSYGRNKKIADYLKRIENNGINILVRTTDSNINEKFIAKCFDLPLNSVKVVSNTAGEVLKNYAEHTVLREDAKMIHNGTAAAFLHAVSSAGKLCSTAGKINSLQIFSMAAGLLLTVLIMIFSGPLSLTALPVCICQSVWIIIAAILPLFGKE